MNKILQVNKNVIRSFNITILVLIFSLICAGTLLACSIAMNDDLCGSPPEGRFDCGAEWECLQWFYEPREKSICGGVPSSVCGRTDCQDTSVNLIRWVRLANCTGLCDWEDHQFNPYPAGTCDQAVLSGATCGDCGS
jgi:hypothetical protein